MLRWEEPVMTDTTDTNVRMCLGCKGMFAPYSMGKDGEPVVEPPVAYRCMTCRTKQTGMIQPCS